MDKKNISPSNLNKFERGKLIQLYKIYEDCKMLIDSNERIRSYVKIVHPIVLPLDGSLSFDIRVFMLTDYFLHITLMTILALFIFEIIGENLAFSILKLFYKQILKSKAKSINIRNFLNLSKDIIICYYQILYDHLNNLYNNSKKNEKVKYDSIRQCLELNKLILLCNKIRKSDRFIIYDQNITQNDRRIHINRKLIRYIESEINLFKEISTIVRFLSDFIQLNNFGEKLLQFNTFEYRVFLEIVFLFNNHKTEENGLSDRNFQHHRYQILGNTLEFLKKKIIENEIKNKCGLNERNSLFGTNYVKTENSVKRRSTNGSVEYKLIPKGIMRNQNICHTESSRPDKARTNINSLMNSIDWKDSNFTEMNSPTRTISLSKENREIQYKSTNKLLHKRLMSYGKDNKELPLLRTHIVLDYLTRNILE